MISSAYYMIMRGRERDREKKRERQRQTEREKAAGEFRQRDRQANK